jgi:hypothetical protein
MKDREKRKVVKKGPPWLGWSLPAAHSLDQSLSGILHISVSTGIVKCMPEDIQGKTTQGDTSNHFPG